MEEEDSQHRAEGKEAREADWEAAKPLPQVEMAEEAEADSVGVRPEGRVGAEDEEARGETEEGDDREEVLEAEESEVSEVETSEEGEGKS
jgi:hypothetical protein